MSQAPFDLARMREAVSAGRVLWSEHAVRRLHQRGLDRAEVLRGLNGGEVIESYPDDTPYPSALLLWFAGDQALHVVVALDANGPEAHVITVYEPSPDKFEPDWRTRRTS